MMMKSMLRMLLMLFCGMQLTSLAVAHTKVVNCNNTYNTVEYVQVLIAVMQTKVINCNSSNKGCLFQVMHTKAVAALTKFCDFSHITIFSNNCHTVLTHKSYTLTSFLISLLKCRSFALNVR